MSDVFDHFDLVLKAFWLTIQLFLLLGPVLAAARHVLASMRVGPVSVLRKASGVYVTVVRNTPLLMVFIFVFVAAPRIDINFDFLAKGVIALTIYTSTFVCEAIRSGINSVPLGQAEAARSIGLTFAGSMREVVLPQAVRATVPPLASVLIALLKNTSVGAAFGLLEATARMRYFTNNNADDRLFIFFVFALGYVILVELLLLRRLETRAPVEGGHAMSCQRPVRLPRTQDRGPSPDLLGRRRRWPLIGLVALVVARLEQPGTARLRPVGAVHHAEVRRGAPRGPAEHPAGWPRTSVVFAVVFGLVFGTAKLSDRVVDQVARLGWSSSSSAPCRCCC